ncbi:MAG: NAD(P)-dependent oxidoreductase [Dysgonamonadaceae bacterium]|jgi:nucleoside-diphosphate-sugar epimerase|nr:NAD(P)-dependent oxidoreductase [Dysgonamonadaceae bacterium]
MKKILITGAGGFIGSFLVEEALKSGLQVWAGVRSTTNREYLRDERIAFIDLNFADKARLTEQLSDHAARFGRWDYIVHNAGVTKCLNPADFEKINYLYTRRLVESLLETRMIPEKFILMSSLSAAFPETAYGRSKRKAEQFLEMQTGFPFLIFRPTGVYGPRDKDYLLLLKTIKSGLDIAAGFTPQKLTFIYVKDLAKAVFLTLQSPVFRKTYSVADGDVYSDKEFTRIAKEVLGKKRVIQVHIPLFILKIASAMAEAFSRLSRKPSTLNRDKYKIVKRRDWTCDTSPLEQDSGFRATYRLPQGLQETVDWYRSNGWL